MLRDLMGEGFLQERLRHTVSYYLMDDIGMLFNSTGSNDTIVGGTGNDILSGKGGDDVLLGAEGDDTLIGGGGSDTLYGDAGDDALLGGSGDDTLVGGTGTNSLDGGSGTDTAVYGGIYEDYTISYSGPVLRIRSNTEREVNDSLTNIEYVRFGFVDYSFDYWQDGAASEEPVQSTLPLNTAPVAADDVYTGLEDTSLYGAVLVNDGDGDGDALSAVAFSGTSAAGGSVTMLANGSFVYTPALHFSGADSFEYTVGDGNGGGSSASVNLAVAGVADAPVLNLPGTVDAAFTAENAAMSVSLDISAALTDNDGSETLSVRVSGLPTGATLSAGVVQGDGSWVLAAGDIAGVMIDLPPNVTTDFQLAIVAEAQEIAGGPIAVRDGVVSVDVTAWVAGTSSEPAPEPAPEENSVASVSVKTDLTGQVKSGEFLQADESGEIVGLRLENNSGATSPSDFSTFGHVFVQGDVPAGSSVSAVIDGVTFDVQMNVKATHEDGSVKHAILTMATPSLAAGASADAMLVLGGGAPGTNITANDVLNTGYDFSVEVTMHNADGSTTTHVVQAADALAAAIADGSLETWFSGSLASEFSVEVMLNDHLKMEFDIRMFADGDIRTDFEMATESTYVGGIETYNYDVAITVDGALAYDATDVAHHRNANWHTQLWSGNEPDVFAAFDVEYMASTGAIPHYDTSLGVKGSMIESGLLIATEDAGPMATAGLETYMPTTGGRADIGLLPTWAARYLVSQNQDAFDAMMAKADAGGSIPWHFVDEATGTYVSVFDHPDLWIDYRQTEGTDALADPYLDLKTESGWTPDRAHQPSLSYLPYLVTGDKYHLDNQLAQAAFTIASVSYTYRDKDGGVLVLDTDAYQQIRGSAWTLRTLTETTFAIPDGHQLESYFEEVTSFSLDYMVNKYITNGEYDASGEIEGFFGDNHFGNIGDQRTGLYMQDFFVSSLALANERGYDTGGDLAEWSQNFIAGRFINSENGYNADYGGGYYLYIYNRETDELASTWEDLFVNTFGTDAPALDVIQGSPTSTGGSVAFAKMALTSLINTTGEADPIEAYGFLMAESFGTKAFNYTYNKSYYANPTYFGMAEMSDGSYLSMDQMRFGGSAEGASGNELLYGSDLNDVISGNGGIDWIYGAEGDDTLSGGAEDDFLFGGAGSDTLTGGTGDDYLKGNAGADTFLFQSGDTGFDTIADFDALQDSLMLSSDLVSSSLDAIISGAYVQNDGVVLDLGDLQIFLDGVSLDALSSLDIVIG